MKYVDSLNGRNFELFTGKLLQDLGYKHIHVTKPTGDCGLDILATDRTHTRIGVQCKHLRKNECVQFRAVEETYTGKAIYGTNIGIILTNQNVSRNIRKYSKKLGIRCWDRNILRELITIANNIHSILKIPNRYRTITKIKTRYSNTIKSDYTKQDIKLLYLIAYKDTLIQHIDRSTHRNFFTLRLDLLKRFLYPNKKLTTQQTYMIIHKILTRIDKFNYKIGDRYKNIPLFTFRINITYLIPKGKINIETTSLFNKIARFPQNYFYIEEHHYNDNT